MLNVMLTLFRDDPESICTYCGSDEGVATDDAPGRQPFVRLMPYRKCLSCGRTYEPRGTPDRRAKASLVGLWLLITTVGLVVGSLGGIFGPLGALFAVPFGCVGYGVFCALRRTQSKPGGGEDSL